MKTKMIILGVFTFLVFTAGTYAQNAADTKWQEVKIKTSAQCGMCKDRLEGAMAFEKGVKKSELNLENKVLTVTYHSKKTSPEKIRAKVSATGYDADDVVADQEAYNALPACCKKKEKKGCSPGCKH